MTQWRPDFNPDSLYFVTTKAVQYARLFQTDVVKRLLVDYLENPEDYLWSSARFYLLGKPAMIPLDNATTLLL